MPSCAIPLILLTIIEHFGTCSMYDGVKPPQFGQPCTGFRKSNKHHRILDKISFHLIPNLASYAILHTKVIISQLGSSL